MAVRSWFRAVVCVLSVFALQALGAEVNGVLQVVKGDVQIKSGKTGALTKAKVGSKVFPKDSIITGKDSRAKVVMVDKNVLNISPESNIEIQNYEYAPEQGKKDVLLNVIYGKVRSKVEQKYDGQTTKFEVKTATAVAGVRGTDFMASYQPQSHTSSVVTFEGTVAFGQLGPGGRIMNEVAVPPGKTTEVVGNSPPPEPHSVPPSELAAMDKDSKADSGSSAGGNDSREPAAKDGGKEKDKDTSDKKEGQSQQEDKKSETDKKSPDKSDGDKGQANESGADKGKSAGAEGDKGKAADKAPNEGGGDKGRGSDGGGRSAGTSSGESRGGGPGQGPGAPGGPSGGPGGSSTAGGPPAGAPMNPDRMPASGGMPPSPGGGGSMLLPTDLAGAPNAPVVPVMPVVPNVPQMPPTIPKCDFCDRAIENGTALININVNYNNP